jgi:hypothetical protein
VGQKGNHAVTNGRHAVDYQSGFENVLVVDNIPIVDEGKKQKLVDRLRQTFEKVGAAIDEDRISMPWDDEAKTNKGYVWLIPDRSRWKIELIPDSSSLLTLMLNKPSMHYERSTTPLSVKPIPCMSTDLAISRNTQTCLLERVNCHQDGRRSHTLRGYVAVTLSTLI